jgi:hypothetical protein
MATAMALPIIVYQGPGIATETWGFTQANFLVGQPGRAAKECAVMLNDPAARQLIAELQIEDTQEVRERLARLAGEAWLGTLAEQGAYIGSVITISVAFLNTHPEVAEATKRAME